MSCMRVFGILPSVLNGFSGFPSASNTSEVRRLTGLFCRLSAGSHPKRLEPIRRFSEDEISMLVQNP